MFPLGSGGKVNKLLLHSIFSVPFSQLNSVLSLEAIVHKYLFRSQQNYLEGMLNDQFWLSTTPLFCFVLFYHHGNASVYPLGKTDHSFICYHFIYTSFISPKQNSNTACSSILCYCYSSFSSYSYDLLCFKKELWQLVTYLCVYLLTQTVFLE